ncbi:isoprenoid synthase domain-containing protein [Suillus cothurnatus]|nr:isoprenoid synthase domain-containing protein [Suillus cothurnatus]
MQRYESLPPQFYLHNIAAINGRVSSRELRVNPHQAEADRAARSWFNQLSVYDDRKTSKFLNGKFDLLAALTFPDADCMHLETCLMFHMWAFSADDLTGEDDLQSKPDAVQAGYGISVSVYTNPDGSRPRYPYAAMLHEAFEASSSSQVIQSRNRAQDQILSVDEFILMRRATVGGALVGTMVEYSLDLDLPDIVFENPIIKVVSDTITDIGAYSNKEQSDGDYQNLEAINILTEMLNQRVDDYIKIKSLLPSFGTDVDVELERYFHAMENFVQGAALWYYFSPRFFHGIDATNRENLVVTLFEKGAV